MTIADFPDWQAPQAHATAIAATGAPLLIKPANLVNQASFTVPAAGVSSTTLIGMTQPGYTILVSVNFASTATVPFVRCQLNWTDTTSGVRMATDTFVLAGSTAAGGMLHYGAGLVKADQLGISLFNLDPGHAAVVNLTLVQYSAVHLTDRWGLVNDSGNGMLVPGYTLASLPDDESVLGTVSSASIPASGSSKWLCGIGNNGWVNLAGNTSGPAPSALTVTCFAEPAAEYGSGGIAFRQALSQVSFAFTFKAPRTSLSVEITNSSTTSGGLFSFLMCMSP